MNPRVTTSTLALLALPALLALLALPGSLRAQPGSELPAGAGNQAAGGNYLYEGGYDVSYTVLSGALEICTTFRLYRFCAPIELSIPLEQGSITGESLEAAFEAYKILLHETKLPERVLTLVDAAVEEVLLPALAAELDAALVLLPVEMEIDQGTVAASSFTATFVGGDSSVYYGIGALTLETGAFQLIPDYVKGWIDPSTALSGGGSAIVPVNVQESVVIAAPWGTETIGLEARGQLGAQFVLARR